MQKLLKMTLAMALGLGAVVLAHTEMSTAAEEKTPSVSVIMKKSFGKDGYKTSITTAAKDAKWDAAVKMAKEWVELATVMGKNTPPKGEAKSWETQCSKFCDSTKATLKATEDKDAEAVEKALKTIDCGACHRPHRLPKK